VQPGSGVDSRRYQPAVVTIKVELIRQKMFFLGGVLPVWFGGNGLLLQKLFVDPGFGEMQLHSERAHHIRDLVQED
jgi:hypothetical protein